MPDHTIIVSPTAWVRGPAGNGWDEPDLARQRAAALAAFNAYARRTARCAECGRRALLALMVERVGLRRGRPVGWRVCFDCLIDDGSETPYVAMRARRRRGKRTGGRRHA